MVYPEKVTALPIAIKEKKTVISLIIPGQTHGSFLVSKKVYSAVHLQLRRALDDARPVALPEAENL